MVGNAFAQGDRLLNIGHRGSPKAAPENTLRSFQTACDVGADGVELDVMLSADGEVVVIHDSTVDRTTDGRGPVRSLTLAQLKVLDAGVQFGAQFAGERIPTLVEVVTWAQGGTLLNIELKSGSLRDDGLEGKVVEIVRQGGVARQVLFSSFNPLSLRRVKRAAPDIPTGLLYAADLPIYLSRAWSRRLVRPAALHPHYTLVTDAYMLWAKRQGHLVNVWTPDAVIDLQQLIHQRVDAIITNRPDVLATLLKR